MSRLFYLQILKYKEFSALALGQQTGIKEISGKRGEIFFINSRESKGAYNSGEAKSIAINKEKWNVNALPFKIEDKNNFSEILAADINETKESVFSKLSEGNSFAIIKKDIPQPLAQKLKSSALEGVDLEKVWARYYPQGVLASQVVGFLGGDGVGQYGIEGHYEDVLSGKSGIVEEKKGLNLINFLNQPKEDFDGADIFLTIDYNVQFQAESLLAKAKEEIGIESGQIIVLKPDSGRVLALANFPSFDPNQYSKEKNFEIFQNSALQKVFEPGSVFKPFTMAMALEDKKIDTGSFFTDEGFAKIGPDTLYNFNRQKYGKVSMSEIIEKSINTGAVFLSLQVGRTSFFNHLENFGFTKKTGIDLQGEVSSRNEILRTGSATGYATASFGQGIEMTPIQLAGAFSIFANRGKMISPYVVEKIEKNGAEKITKPAQPKQVISEKTAEEVTKMLINVVEKGFGSSAKIEGYYLAGKTGTAEVPFEGKKGYYQDRTIQSFAGYGPALKPQFLILVKLDNPKVPKSSLSAVPIFKKLAQYIINYWQIPPDY